ncbi:unnamed protein product [Nyctereutes procyonoides]|uniref:(raccoon dog) hypothetical protein n=1 Tax=Nyctereutes procyonoides TaxID=34880 RepID=A0A811ZQP4_NYCPR|nr:unnamed protein product [Nyctereutes procyonoides]
MMDDKRASASRVVQVVNLHTLLIWYLDRRDNPKPISQHSKESKPSDLLMHWGPPDTTKIIKILPQKYRRKLVSQEEIEFIQYGGPE